MSATMNIARAFMVFIALSATALAGPEPDAPDRLFPPNLAAYMDVLRIGLDLSPAQEMRILPIIRVQAETAQTEARRHLGGEPAPWEILEFLRSMRCLCDETAEALRPFLRPEQMEAFLDMHRERRTLFARELRRRLARN
jgi:hypothetical protein